MRKWLVVTVLSSNLALHNLQRFAPVTLYDEIQVLWSTDYTGAGSLFAAYLIAYAVMVFPMGMLADRFDNRKLLMLGAGLNMAASVLFALSPNLTIAMLARLALGASGAFLYVPSVRYVVTGFDQTIRGRVMGWVQVGAGVGQVIGFTLIPLLAGHAGFKAGFLMPVVLVALLLIGQGIFLESTHSSGKKMQSMGSVFRTKGFKPFLAFVFLSFLSYYALTGWLPTYLRHDFGFDATKAGLTASLSAIALAICSPLAGLLSDHIGSRKIVLLAGSAISMIGFAILVFSNDVQLIIFAALLIGAGSAMTIPVSQMFAGEVFAVAGAGVALGFTSTTSQLASSASGPLFGLTLDSTGSFSTLWSVALACVVMSLLCMTMVKESKWNK